MAFQPVQLVATQFLAASVAPIYTTPAAARALVKSASFNNTSPNPQTFTVHVVPAAGSPAPSNQVLSAIRLAPGEVYIAVALLNVVLEPGDTIQAVASAATSVTATVGGLLV